MSASAVYQWHDERLSVVQPELREPLPLTAADSWLVNDGKTLALNLHRERFLDAVPPAHQESAANFFETVLAQLPRVGQWFPRVELRESQLFLAVRPAPERHRSAKLISYKGTDPRTIPSVKGPDIDALAVVQAGARAHGADEAIILTEQGYVVEGATSAILWWRGEILCSPPAEFARIDSVTARSTLTLARALGHDTLEEAVTPPELDGTEVWVLNALHGIRIASDWLEGPGVAQKPGRLSQWQARLKALARAV